jgi:hypothetical protein
LDRDAPDGFWVHSFANDDWQTCRDYVRGRLGLPEWEPGDEQSRRVGVSRLGEFDRRAVDAESAPHPFSDDDLNRIKRAREIWDQAVDPCHTLAEDYLNARGLELGAVVAGRVLRFHARCPWRNENTGTIEFVPALIAAFRSIDNDQFSAIHRIALNPDASKRGKRMLGVVHRAAVKIDPKPIDGELAVGEGVETCVAADQLGIFPVWALGSSGAITHFPVLLGVRKLRLLGENDPASAEAIQACGLRYQRAGRAVTVIKPTTPGHNDLNDVVREATYDGATR